MVFQTFLGATKGIFANEFPFFHTDLSHFFHTDLSHFFTLMMMIFAGSLQSGQWSLWWIKMGLDTLTLEDGRSWFLGGAFNLNRIMFPSTKESPNIFTQKNGIGWLNKRLSKTQRHIWDFHQIDFACQDLADTSFYWKWRDGALRGPFDPSKFSRTLAEMWHPLKAAILQHQNHQKGFHPCVWRSYSVFVVFYQSVLVKDFEIDAWGGGVFI